MILILEKKHIIENIKDKKCILVGSGSHILENDYNIDNYDTVIRFNNYMINNKILKYTGNRTDIIVSGLCNQKKRDVKYIISSVPYNYKHMSFKEKIKEAPLFFNDDSVLFIPSDNDYKRWCKISEPNIISSGMSAIYKILEYFKPFLLKVIGFDFFSVEPIHYYEDGLGFTNHRGYEESREIYRLYKNNLLDIDERMKGIFNERFEK